MVDLFCGCGGISHGFELSGFKSLLGLDNHSDSLATFALNHPEALVVEDDIAATSLERLPELLEMSWGDLDCLVGGPPCQSFSKNVPAKRRFLEDERNFLFHWFLEVVESLGPKTVLIENVAELAGAHNGAIRYEIMERLAGLGYEVIWERLLAANFGVPQMRRRVFFLASRIGSEQLRFPNPTHSQSAIGDPAPDGLEEAILRPYVTVRDAISDLPSLSHGKGVSPMPYEEKPQSEFQEIMRVGSAEVFDHIARSLAPLQLERLQAAVPGKRMQDLPKKLQTKQGFGGAYGRLEWDKPALTITTWVFHPGSGRFGHPRDDRTITMREAARLQSFRDTFHFTGSYNSQARQIGNAVPPLLARVLAEALAKQLDHYFESESVVATVS
jgi:DNA (cytosine-5)-methyltransferase 1